MENNKNTNNENINLEIKKDSDLNHDQNELTKEQKKERLKFIFYGILTIGIISSIFLVASLLFEFL